jgi:ABC-type molybdenum transport system ATPase subunit/photorepair protein PhrA
MDAPAHEVWLITGIPGAGKSTIARALAARLPRAAHIEGDRLGEWIISGRVGWRAWGCGSIALPQRSANRRADPAAAAQGFAGEG